MIDQFWLSDEKIARPEPLLPISHGKPRIADRRGLSGIIFINGKALGWRDAPPEHGPSRTLYSLWKSGGRTGERHIFA